jgi:hypothetical protein
MSMVGDWPDNDTAVWPALRFRLRGNGKALGYIPSARQGLSRWRLRWMQANAWTSSNDYGN